MRVTRRLDDESGATAAVFAVLLLVLVGLVALTIDGGLLWTKHRRVRAANDAAALAAAYSCAKGEGLANANLKADDVATANVGDVAQTTPNAYPDGCEKEGGEVTVRYGDTQELLFGPAVGVSSPKPVIATATAEWAPAGGAVNAMPLMLSIHRLSVDCGIPDVEPGTPCRFWWDNGSPHDQSALTNAEWGLVDLSTWGLDPWAKCSGNANQGQVSDWIANGYPNALLIDPGPHEYVCRGSGFQGGALNNDISAKAGQIVWFPVNDPEQQVQSNGTVCRPNGVDGACTVDKYAIVGFAALEIKAVWTGKDAQTVCEHPAKDNGSLRCLETVFRDYQPGGLLGGGGGQDLGFFAIALIK